MNNIVTFYSEEIGELYVKMKEDSPKRPAKFQSEFIYSGDLNPYEDSDLEGIVKFLNYDCNPLEKKLQNLLCSILDNKPKEEIKSIYAEASQKLIDWHPIFRYETSLRILDMMVDYVFHCNEEIRNADTTFIDTFIEQICTVFFNAVQENLETDDEQYAALGYYHKDVIDSFKSNFTLAQNFQYKAPPKDETELDKGILEQYKSFQNYLIEFMPTKAYYSTQGAWKSFLQELEDRYGEVRFTDDPTYDAMISTLRSVLSKSQNDTSDNPPVTGYSRKYYIQSFEQYVLVHLSLLTDTKWRIVFCEKCGQYYIYHPDLPFDKKHDLNCKPKDCIKQISKHHKTLYNRIYKRYERELDASIAPNSEVPNSEAQNSDTSNYFKYFREYHDYVMRYTMIYDIPFEIYKSFTDQPGYTIEKYRELPHISCYKPILGESST